ncbi:MAG: phage holin family protein [Bowdeniella nasicola]|nr:phage holin family protein [Bowdeniella nasicola]
MRFAVRLFVSAIAIWLASILVPGVQLAPSQSFGEKVLILLIVAFFFTIINMVIRPVVKILSLPLYVLTLGLFALVVNALMLMLTGWVSAHTEFALYVQSFGAAFFGALIISIATWLIDVVLPRPLETRR